MDVFIDNRSLLEAVTGNKGIGDKRLKMNIEIIKQHLEIKEITNLTWVPTEKMLADPLSKKNASSDKLLSVMQSFH